jgi:micrococcal nuclease
MVARRRVVCTVALGTFLLFVLGVAPNPEWHVIRWVNDGDTVVLSDGTSVRYIGINSPEIAHENKPAERFGREAEIFHRGLVQGEKVRLELDTQKKDRYGRLLAYVFLDDGTFVNAEMVKRGYAHFLSQTPNTKYANLFLGLQREAMAKRVGLWRDFKDDNGPFVGNRHSQRFHRIDCPYAKRISKKNRQVFQKKTEAFWSGYSPCSACWP